MTGDFFLTSRMNVYDGFPYPNGFGVAKEGLDVDLTEPIPADRGAAGGIPYSPHQRDHGQPL